MSHFASLLFTLLFLPFPVLGMWQILCGEACVATIGSYKLDCTPEHTAHHGTNLDEAICEASSAPYYTSLAWCLHDRCSTEHTIDKIVEFWKSSGRVKGAMLPDYHQVLPLQEPPIAPVGMKILNATYQVIEEKYWENYYTNGTFEWVERWHARLGYILIFVTLSLCGIGIVNQLLSKYMYRPHSSRSWRSSPFVTFLRKRLIIPALYNKRHSEAIAFGLGYLPTRLMSLFLSFIFILSIVFTCVAYKSVQPSTWFSNRRLEMICLVSNRAGFISFALLPLTILFSSRNNPLIPLTGWTYETFMTMHRWVSRMCAFHAVIHSVGWTVEAWWNGYPEGGAAAGHAYFVERASEPYFWWGIIATIALCLMVLLAAWPIRRWNYELFVLLHVSLGILSLIGCWYHILLRFDLKYGYMVWLYVSFGLWSADRLLRGARIIGQSWRVIRSRNDSTLATAQLLPGCSDLVKITIPVSASRVFGPGQYCFLYFPTFRLPVENHPFSIAGWNHGGFDHGDSGSEKENKTSTNVVATLQHNRPHVTFFIRSLNGTTSALRSRIAASPTSFIRLPVLMEGVYGESYPLHQYETVFLIVGGVGITAALSYLHSHADRLAAKAFTVTTRHVLVWAAREQSFLGAIQEYIEENNLSGPGVETRLFCTRDKLADDSRIAMGRPDVVTLVREEISAIATGRIAFFVCGPGGMADAVRATVVDCIGGDVDGDRVEFFQEAFFW